MARIVSFVVLVAILLVIAGLFFKVISAFLLPLFLAALLVVMFGPLHRWFVSKCRGYDRAAAGLTTVSIMLLIMIPFVAILVPAYFEGRKLILGDNSPADTAGSITRQDSPATGRNQPKTEPSDANESLGLNAVQSWVAEECVDLGEGVGIELEAREIKKAIAEKTEDWLAPVAKTTAQYVAAFLIGLGVMVISLYYFLADGPAMIRTVMRLSPLDDKYEEQLIAKFDDMTRAVVVATLLSAFVQGILAGIGFFVAGLDSAFLLTALAMLLAMVPFVGSTAVWGPVCLWLHFYEGSTTTAVLLALYCAAIVSTADNVIKPLVLHGRANLHPLLALLSVLGGVQALGPIGIFVGPMVVAFLQTLLNMLQTEMNAMAKNVPPARQPSL